MSEKSNKVSHLALVLGLALIVCVLSLAFPLQSLAMLSGCRTDPVITLSNGVVVDVYVDISVDATSVKSVEYDVHVPAGVKMLSYAATPTTGLKGKESVVIFNDAAAGQYTASAVVRTSASATWQTTLVILSLPTPTPTSAAHIVPAASKPTATPTGH